VHAVAFSPDGKLLATGGQAFTRRGQTPGEYNSGGEVKLWDPATGKELASLPLLRELGGKWHHGAVYALAFSADRKTLFAGGTEIGERDCYGEVRAWDLATRKERARFRGAMRAVHGLALSPDDKTLAVAGMVRLPGHHEPGGTVEGSVILWDVATGKAGRILSQDAALVGTGGIAFAPDGKTLAWNEEVSLTGEGCTKLWDMATGKERARFPGGGWSGRKASMCGLAFAPDGKTLAATGDEPADNETSARFRGYVQLLNTATGKLQRKVLGPSEEDQRLAKGSKVHSVCFAVAFSPDGKLLAASGEGTSPYYRARLCEPATGKELAVLEGHRDMITSVAFAPDGSILATGSRDGTVKLWENVSLLERHAVSPDK
jgi:WD40 repeat protein